MQRKSTPLQRLRQEYPFIPDELLQNALNEARGDVRVATEKLRPKRAVPPHDQRPSRRDTVTMEVAVSVVESAAVSSVMRAEEPSSPTDLPSNNPFKNSNNPFKKSNNPFKTLLLQPHECACCFHDTLYTEGTFCSGDTRHFFCLACAGKYAKEEIAKSRFTLCCFDGSGCKAPFKDQEIKRFLDKKTLENFEKLKTHHEIEKAAIEGLVYCPFCPYAAIMEDPTDRLFNCLNCGIISCRYCRVKSHHPISCDRYQSDKNLSAKHIVEEAMTKAFVRKCNKCQKPFVKEDGCNKMKCSCGNAQCYVCSENIADYMHFDEALGRCPMYGDMKDHIKDEVAMAQEVTVQKLLRDCSELRDEDIRVEKLTSGLGKQTANLDPLDEAPPGGLTLTMPTFTMENVRPRKQVPWHPPAGTATAPTASQIPPLPTTMYYEPLGRDVEHAPHYVPPYAPWFNFVDNPPLISPPLQVYDPPPFFEHVVERPSVAWGESFPYPKADNYFEDSTPRAEAGPSRPTGNKLKKRSLTNGTYRPGLNQ